MNGWWTTKEKKQCEQGHWKSDNIFINELEVLLVTSYYELVVLWDTSYYELVVLKLSKVHKFNS